MEIAPGAGFPFVNGVKAISNCLLTVDNDIWPYAEENAAEIDAHWERARNANPSLFNGIVYLTSGMQLSDGALHVSLVRTDFKSHLLWRAKGFPEAGVLDGFGSALIRSSDGDVLLGLQRPGHMNSGFAYLPSGFIDENDVDADGSVDIVRGVMREVVEETGVEDSDFTKDEGFYLVRSGPQLCIAVPLHVSMTTAEFSRAVEQHNATTADPELDRIVPVSGLGDLDTVPLLPFTRLLLETIFASG
jgi:8-oxo-dGTP pyrophosphatase MutT (NUDIX family)